ncbi:desiccation-related protein PCC13-62-like [Eucalyptus grandis]|uniref:desiccation-related protein PCC13-62-like n=1 Tax=Eucalyptus grandis TaxID=71139 RepID=UPI00192EA1BD|nr:desiccation-related protein PCC13-62-like [Eucalyptus grandis]
MKASYFCVVFLLPFFLKLGSVTAGHAYCGPIPATDAELIHVAMNLEFLEAEFFLYGALGKGLDSVAPYLALGGPPPIGGKKANLDPLVQQIIEEFGYEEVGHLRAIYTTVGGIQRPLIDISAKKFAMIVDSALGHRLWPPFDPYLSSVNYLLASYLIPYVGLTGYVGTIPNLSNYTTKALVAGLLGVESGQDAVIRALLYERAHEKVVPYDVTVVEFTNLFSIRRNKLGMCGIKDEGIIVPPVLGAEQRIDTNVLSSNKASLSYPRTPQEVLRVVYGTGNEHVPGRYFPHGANGEVARRFLEKKA